MLDTLRVAADDLRHDNAAALLAALENPSPSRIAGQVTALHRRLSAHELAALREVMLLWAQQVAKRRIDLNLGIRDMAEMDRLHESGDLEAYYAARLRAWQDEYRAEGRAQGIERGIEQGLAAERDLLRRLAARKFGAGTAERLASLLAPIGDTRRLAEVGDWIIDCTTGDDLIARFGNGAEPSPWRRTPCHGSRQARLATSSRMGQPREPRNAQSNRRGERRRRFVPGPNALYFNPPASDTNHPRRASPVPPAPERTRTPAACR